MLLIFLTTILVLSLSEARGAASPQVYSPVVLSELCRDVANYCIYVDQVRPGTVRASPVNATDARKFYAAPPTLLPCASRSLGSDRQQGTHILFYRYFLALWRLGCCRGGIFVRAQGIRRAAVPRVLWRLLCRS